MWWCSCFIASCLLGSVSISHAEVYTALADMEELLTTEVILIHTLDKYIEAQEERLTTLKKISNGFKMEHAEAAKDVKEYLANPINAFLVVKRLIMDWKQAEHYMKDHIYEEAAENMTRYKQDLKFPTEEDLSGAAAALLRLQDTYNLDTTSVARGELNGVQYTSQLTASDCFELGRQSYNTQDFYHTALWMGEALRRHELDRNKTTTAKWEILEYLAYSKFMQGQVMSALHLTEELLMIFPTHQRALGNKVYYQEELKKSPELMQETPANNILSTTLEPTEREKYEMLCRGDLTIPSALQAQLRCRYVHNNVPFLRLMPLKEEEAHLSPRIVLYRDVMYDSEIDLIKSMAQPRLRRATVQNYKTGELEVANYRISKSAWLKEPEHPVVERISRRVEHMTGLTTSTAEELQVVNYGIGGHYEPHYDFARPGEANAFKSLGTGNRIATVLFYMSDVAQGGATVFTSLNLSLWPEKGTAAFWHNLHSSGDGDYLTRHAACPVLTGSKWVSNKWLHEVGQEFLRSCDPTETISNQELS